MIRIQLSAPQSFGLWEGDRLVAQCHFSMEGTAAVLESIERSGPDVDGLDVVDALVRATVNHLLPLGATRVLCRDAALFDNLTQLRFTPCPEGLESTPSEVLKKCH